MTARNAWFLGLTAVAVGVYALMWIGFASHWNWLATIDLSTLEALHRYGSTHRGWVTAWTVFCTIFAPLTFRLLALAGIVVALIRRNLRVALFLLISVVPSGLLTEVAKAAAHRPRPGVALVTSPSPSFPSGHAVGAMVGVLALLTAVLPVVRGPLRTWLIAGGALLVIAVGAGRVVLNAHYPSDVVAGWALGYVYFALCFLIVSPRQRTAATDQTPAMRDSGP